MRCKSFLQDILPPVQYCWNFKTAGFGIHFECMTAAPTNFFKPKQSYDAV